MVFYNKQWATGFFTVGGTAAKNNLPCSRARGALRKMPETTGALTSSPPESPPPAHAAARYVWSTADGCNFDGPTAVASHVGVSTGAVSTAATEALQRQSTSFQCNGHTINRRQIVRQLTSNADPPEYQQEFLFTLTPFMQVYAHLQAAALRFYPDRKLLVPVRSQHQMQTVRTWMSRESQQYQFDLAQVWKMHSPSTFTTPYSFRRALLGEPQETPTSELSNAKYPSLTFFSVDMPCPRLGGGSLTKLTVSMSAADIIKFLLSDFARKGQFDEIFELPAGGAAPAPAPVVDKAARPPQGPKPAAERWAGAPPAPPAPPLAPPAPPPAPSPRQLFSSASLERMRELEANLRASAQAQGECPREGAKRRRVVAGCAIGSITRILFDANKLLLDQMIEGDDAA